MTYEQFSENPISIMNNSELVIRIGNKNYDWMTGGPLLLSLVIFRKPLSQVGEDSLCLGQKLETLNAE